MLKGLPLLNTGVSAKSVFIETLFWSVSSKYSSCTAKECEYTKNNVIYSRGYIIYCHTYVPKLLIDKLNIKVKCGVRGWASRNEY